MIEDVELLRRYAEDRSQDAFAELVRRRVNLVYSVALRQVGGDAHLAEDVTQRVFADLARKAGSLAGHAVLSGWLYRSAQFAATDVVRTERRRRVREQEAQTMNKISADGSAPVDWEKLRPVLDQAMGELDEEDRDAVALRFFEERSLAEVGSALRISEDAARKRVSRALDQLHGLLAQRGVTSTSAALGLALAGQATVAAPAGLAASVTGVALAGTAATSVGWLTAFMGMSKLQVGITGALAVAGGSGYFAQAETNAGLQREIATLRGQQAEVVALRAENRTLANTAAEIEMLRRDDAELKRLVEDAAEAKKRIEENARLAQVRENQRNVQAEIDRMNREGNALVAEYRVLSQAAKNASLTVEEKEKELAYAQQKLEAIKAKQREVNAFKASHGLGPPPSSPMPEGPRGEIRALPGGGTWEFRRKAPNQDEAVNQSPPATGESSSK